MEKISSFYFALLTTFIALILLPFKRKISPIDLLLSERAGEAADNSLHLFNYILRYHSEINVYYVYNSNPNTLLSFNDRSKIIKYRSFKHVVFFILTKVQISTHLYSASPTPRLLPLLNKFGLIRQKFVYLKHGIIKDYMSIYTNAKIDLFICGALPEYNYICETFGYTDMVVKYTGLPRFDNLEEAKKKYRIIAYIPTWRKWLYVKPPLNKSEIVMLRNSEYVLKINELLNSIELHTLLDKYDYHMKYYPHPQTQKYIWLFNTSSDRIEICGTDISMQDVIKESDYLITDYSSVLFDYAYQSKKMSFYHFDYERYRLNHYPEGYFDYYNNELANVSDSLDKLLAEIEIFISNDELIKLNAAVVTSYFSYLDNNNCSRVMSEVTRLLL